MTLAFKAFYVSWAQAIVAVFDQATLDSEVHTIGWPCGADFDPATLHDWPEHEAAFRAAAERWSHANAKA